MKRIPIAAILMPLIILLSVSCTAMKERMAKKHPVAAKAVKPTAGNTNQPLMSAAALEDAPPSISAFATPPPVLHTPWTTNPVPSGAAASNVVLLTPIRWGDRTGGVTNSWTYNATSNVWIFSGTLAISGIGGGGSPVAAGTNGIVAVTNTGVVTFSFSGSNVRFFGMNQFGTNATQGLLTIDGYGNLSVYGTNTAVLTFYDSNTNPIAGWDGVMWYGDAGLLTDIPAAQLTNSQGPLPLNVIPPLWDSVSAPMGSWFTNNLVLPASFNQPTNMGDAWMFSSGTSNEIRFRCNLPGSWDTNVIYAQLRAESSGTNNSTATNVVLGVSAVAVGDGDNESTVTFGAEVLVTNHISTAAYVSRACTTAAITVGNNPAPEKALVFKIRRLSPGPGGDTMTNTFYLTDAQIYYRKNPGSVTGITSSP